MSVRQALTSNLYPQYYLLFSVVGQKAVFKYFFERMFEEFQYGITPEAIIDLQKTCVEDLNNCLFFLHERGLNLFGNDPFDISESLDERILEFGTIAFDLWEGILYEDDRIIYNMQGVKAFCDILAFLVDAVKAKKEDNQEFKLSNYSFRFSIVRTKRLLKKRFGNRGDEEFEEIAIQIIDKKKEILWLKINS